ncbi:uncharacterized protein LOC129308233 [Prosopis cineraria]|uniref:uncharacterized protein LOC129308233 n=1 Tax=Prosopis cineraria TaxID=364024 RepID=UPI00240F4A27|nr:uncharacterized protein LOC129308233 [Prosopis cineraria]
MEFQYFPRNYDGRRHSGWKPSATVADNDHDDGGGSRGPYHRQHHPKHHVTFKADEEEIRTSSSVIPQENVVVYDNDRSDNYTPKGVDEEADAFIKHEHSRIRLARLRSLNPV